jgi:uncharacterized protein (DUF1684 family)
MLSFGRGIFCIWYGLLLLTVVIGQPGCSKQPDQAEVNRYIEEIETHRAMKDLQFKKGRNSPLTAAGRQNFQQLHYFPVDYNYRVSARYVRNPAPRSSSPSRPPPAGNGPTSGSAGWSSGSTGQAIPS